MPKLKFNLVVDNGDSQITVYHGGKTHIANSTHPNWEKIYKGVMVDDLKVIDLFDIATALKRQRLSERVLVAGGKVFFDNDEIHDTLTEQIVRIMGEKGDPQPWVRFLENVATNPNPHSREHLYRHLKTNRYTITEDGLFVGYKYVYATGKPNEFRSGHAGYAIVDGEVHTKGCVPNRIGSVIEMPRSRVTFDPKNGCSFGLHVGNWDYVRHRNDIVEVHVNPRDVVSVPVDAGDAKVRVCRYTVIEKVTKPYNEAVVRAKPPVKVKLSSDAAKALSRDIIEREKAPKKETAVSTSTRVRYPRPADWDNMVARAKTRKQSLIKYVQKMTDWTLLEGREGRDRKDWAV